MKIRFLAILTFGFLFFIALPTVSAQSPSCIQAWVNAGNVQGIVSYNPVVYEPNNCIDGAHSIGQVEPTDPNQGSMEETRMHTSATITEVSVSVDYEDNCQVLAINPTVSGSGIGQFSDFNGTHGGYIYFTFSSNSGVQGLDGTAQVTISVTDNTGNSAAYSILHTCPGS